MIEAAALTVRFGVREALSSVSLKVAPGELVGIVGAAASGKSVLLKTLCLLVRPASGVVRFDDHDLTAAAPGALAKARARIGFCFQNLALFDQLDAASNVAFALARRGVPSTEARTRAFEQLKQVGLAGAEAKLPHELSGGMKRRLALARAMVSVPMLALYDDPFVGLDPVACARIARLIAASHRSIGGATIVAAGDPSPLFEVADRLILLENGRVVVDLPAREFRPENAEAIARYLGSGGLVS